MKNKVTDAFGLTSGIFRVIHVWARRRPSKIAVLWRHYRRVRKAGKIRGRLLKSENILVPQLIILSATMRCNLDCTGCYSRDYPDDGELSLEAIDDIFSQAKALGVSFFVITGGEPLMRAGLPELLVKHRDLIFILFNNGTYIDRDFARKISRADNIVPILSIEGGEKETDARRGSGVYRQVLDGISCLRDARVFFGFSATVCKDNQAALESEAFYDEMIRRGCRMGFCIEYVPTGKNPDFNLILKPDDRKRFREKMLRYQKIKRLILIHMPDDEYMNGHCMAAGLGFVHINSQGYVEPCPFSHIATHSMKTATLKDALQTPLFTYIREHPELLQPPQIGCSLFENREQLIPAALKLGARSTEN